MTNEEDTSCLRHLEFVPYQAIQKENMEASRTEGIDVDLQLLRPKARKDFSKEPKDSTPSSET